ncbi:MAG: sulfate/molybdate ABC transporter ATP-binding protein [bacterium]
MLSALLDKRLGSFHLDVTFSATPGRTLVLVGESGSGKSTILHVLAGLLDPDRGRVVLDDVVLFDSERGVALPAHLRPVGFVFQDYALFPHLSVFENVAFGLRAQNLPHAHVERHARAVLDQVGIADLAARKSRALSGGQRQRVALARALAVEPRLLLLDEPLAALDLQTRAQVRAELRRRLSDLTCATIFVTHSPYEALLFGDQIAVVESGRIVQIGPRDELLRHPRTAYVAQLMGLNFLHGKVVSNEAGGITVVETEGARVLVAGPLDEEQVFLVVDPREITLHLTPPSGSAQNVFAGPIVEMVPEPPFGDRVRVLLGTRPPIVAEVTARAIDALGLREGTTVYASVKATAPRAFT